MNLAQFLDLSQFSYPELIGYRGGLIPKRKYSNTVASTYYNDSLNSSIKRPATTEDKEMPIHFEDYWIQRLR